MDISLKTVMTYERFSNLVKCKSDKIHYFILEYDPMVQGRTDFTKGENELFGVERFLCNYDISEIRYLFMCCIDKINMDSRSTIISNFLHRMYSLSHRYLRPEDFNDSYRYIEYLKIVKDMQRVRRCTEDLQWM